MASTSRAQQCPPQPPPAPPLAKIYLLPGSQIAQVGRFVRPEELLENSKPYLGYVNEDIYLVD